MKFLTKAAAVLSAAVLGCGAVSFPALSAADSVVPEWVPQDYDSALEFVNTYGTTRVIGNKVCLVFAEPMTPEGDIPVQPPYVLNTPNGGMRELYREIFLPPEDMRTENAVQLEVISVVGFVEARFSFEFSPKPPSEANVHAYSFYTDRNFETTETDVYGWVPDSPIEFQNYKKENGAISVHGNQIAFCITNTSGTQYSWHEMKYDTEAANKLLVSGCNGKSIESGPPVTGGSSNSVHVYEAKKDGPLTLGWFYGDPEEPESAKDTLTESFEIVENASVVLRPTDVFFRLVDSESGEYLTIDKENPPVLDISVSAYLDRPSQIALSESSTPVVDPVENIEPVSSDTADPVTPVIEEDEYTYMFTENPMVLPVAKAYSNSLCNVNMREETVPKNYKCTEFVCHSHQNHSYTIEYKFRYEKRGDVNFDTRVGVADLVLMQRWLCGDKQASLRNWHAGDMNEDGQLDARDVTLLKRLLLETVLTSPHCRLDILTHYGGYGVNGQDLGSGEFTEYFTVAEGDQFVDAMFDGHWIKNGTNYRNDPILLIEKITEDGVTVVGNLRVNNQRNCEETVIPFDSDPVEVGSTFTVFDGINYSYEIRFSRIDGESPAEQAEPAG